MTRAARTVKPRVLKSAVLAGGAAAVTELGPIRFAQGSDNQLNEGSRPGVELMLSFYGDLDSLNDATLNVYGLQPHMFTPAQGPPVIAVMRRSNNLVLAAKTVALSAGVAAEAETVTNGDFTAGTGWETGPGWAIAAGVATHSGGRGNLSRPITAPALDIAQALVGRLTVNSISGGEVSMRMALQQPSTPWPTSIPFGRRTAAGELYAVYDRWSGVDPMAVAESVVIDSDATCEIDDVSIRAVTPYRHFEAIMAEAVGYGGVWLELVAGASGLDGVILIAEYHELMFT